MGQFLDRLSLAALPTLAHLIIKYISRSLHLQLIGAEPVIAGKQAGKNYIFAFWHNHFFVMPFYYAKFLPAFNISVLTSRSRDGEYISRVLEKFDFQPVRGSSSKGGQEAMRLLLRQLKEGNDIAVTPDGPRGPRHKVQAGIVSLAQLSGCPIIPVGYQAERKKVLNTWDRFIIPRLFTKGKFIVGKEICVDRDLSPEQKEQARRQLEEALLQLSPD